MKKIIGVALLLVTFVTMSGYATAQTYPQGMVSYWKFDEGSGTMAYDSANSNDGTIYGATWTTGKVGGALSFDGSNDYIEIPDDPSLRGMPELTVEAWAYPTSVVDDWDGIVVKRNSYGAGNVTYQLYIRRTPDHLPPHPTFGVANESGTISGLACTETVLSPNQWYHFVGLYTDDTVKLYVNGTLCGEKPLVGENVYDAAHRFVIGTIVYGSGQAYYFNGIIDEVAIYSRALTEEEIQQHHQNGLNGLGYEITPVQMLSDLVDKVISLNLQAGISNSLDAKLDAALSALDDMNSHNDVAAINTLNAFINAVEAQRENKISDEDADMLVATAQAIIAALQSQ